MTRRIQQSVESFAAVALEDDFSLAEHIVRDGIDILIDLAGHTGYNRLSMMGLRPAPVQATFLGFPATTGVPTIDYRITDLHSDPPGMTEHLYTEKLIRVPHTIWCYWPMSHAPEVGEPPAATNGFITFGCFNNPQKISSRTLDAWARILGQMPGSRLMLKYPSFDEADRRERMLRELAERSVDAGRVTLVGKVPYEQHLGHYQQVDIALDTFPYNGTTTTCDALYMGVPVVALEGNTAASRASLCILTNMEMPELIARDADGYVELATALANDLPRLKRMRAELRPRMQRSPLCDAELVTRELEAALRTMWRERCAAAAAKSA
jgi:predicted O-linked N-acetylglucosamine transferase (SPINDLY family)